MTDLVFELQSVHIAHGPKRVFDDLSVQVPAGQWTCLVGPNGVGKSTLLRAMAGLQTAQGSLQFEGRPLSALPASVRARRLAWLGQVDDNDGEWTIEELAMMGRLPHLSGWRIPQADDHAIVERVLADLGLSSQRHSVLSTLSAGQRQRARLARLLATQAPTLLMDEPVTHLDAPHQADWLTWARAWVATGNHLITVLHELPLAMRADHLIVLHQGRCIHQGSPQDAQTRKAIELAFDDRIEWVHAQGQWLSAWRL